MLQDSRHSKNVSHNKLTEQNQHFIDGKSKAEEILCHTYKNNGFAILNPSLSNSMKPNTHLVVSTHDELPYLYILVLGIRCGS